jgi:hypothetical protein
MEKEEAKHIATHLYCQAKSLAVLYQSDYVSKKPGGGIAVVMYRVTLMVVKGVRFRLRQRLRFRSFEFRVLSFDPFGFAQCRS